MYASLTREPIVTREKRIFTIRHLQDEKAQFSEAQLVAILQQQASG
jgi:hypothetical protein